MAVKTPEERKTYRDGLSADEQKIYDKAFKQAKSTFSDDDGKAHEIAVKAVGRSRKETKKSAGADEPGYEITGEIVKVNEERRQVFGYFYVSKDAAGVVKRDHSGEWAPIEEIEKAAYGYVLVSRDMGEMHVAKGKGRLIESVVFTPEKKAAMGIPDGVLPDAWWGGFQVDDEETWKNNKAGLLKMFSIAGKGKRKEVTRKSSGGEHAYEVAQREIEKATSLSDLTETGRAYLELTAATCRFEAIEKGKGADRHGPSIKCPDIYDALRREGKSKETAAKFSNECSSKPGCNCH